MKSTDSGRQVGEEVRARKTDGSRVKVAYVMNGFPRLSETFIAHEIHQLERSGLSLRLFVVKQENEPRTHPVIGRIKAPLTYLPRATSLSGKSLRRWLFENMPAFLPAQLGVLRRRPIRYLRTLWTVLLLCWENRPRKVFIKEFLQAGEISAAVLRGGEIAHLHGHFCHGVATITWFVSQMTGVPFSFTAHAKDIYQRDLNPNDLLERKLGAARFVATCTCANAKVLRDRHPRPDDVHAIYHGLDTDFFSPVPKDATSGPPMILSVGRLVEKKGFDQLVIACAQLKRDGIDFVCRIVGERGDAFERLTALIQSLGLQTVIQLCGEVTQDELRTVYRQAHVFALPCQIMADGDRDGFPNVLAEAMAMGVPVVSTAISGIPEMIDDGVHGLLVSPRDPQGLADALRRLLTDQALHDDLARAARARICERFDSRVTTLQLRDLFERQIGVANRGSA